MLRSGVPPAPFERTRQAQGGQPHDWRAPSQVLSVLAVELPGVAPGVGRRRIPLLAARSAAAPAVPAHRRSVASEAVAMAEHAATQHSEAAYAPVPGVER
jgi:hypothetical protein